MSMQAQEFRIKEMWFGAERHGGTEHVDMRFMTPEISIFESIEKNYITANILVYDDADTFADFLALQGTEKVKMEIDGGEASEIDSMILELRVVSLVKQEKIQDRAAIYAINCISKHAYDDANGKLSRSYTGQLEDTAEKILESYLDVGVLKKKELFSDEDISVQGEVKVIVPYISPLEAVSWLMERATSPGGSPFYAWATVWDQDEGKDNVRYGTLKTMLEEGIQKVLPEVKQKAEDGERSFIFNIMSQGREITYKAQRAVLQSYTIHDTEDTLRMINKGAIGSTISNIDTYTSAQMKKHFDLEKLISNSLGFGAMDTVLDNEDTVKFNGETKTLSNHDSRYRNLVTSYGTYKWHNSYHDNADPSLLVNKMAKVAWSSALVKNRIDVVLGGYQFAKNKIAAGDVIRLVFPVNKVSDDSPDGTDYSKKIDERKSGFYLILGIRRMWIGEQHSVVCDCTRVAPQE